MNTDTVSEQFIHALALFVVAWLISQSPSPLVNIAGWSFVTGIILFSGSLYLLSLTQIKILGIITPIGGLAFLVGWACLVIH